MAKVRAFLKLILLSLIRLYRLCLSPWLGQHCRFYPTCSQYALEAIEQHGMMSGAFLAVKRLLRCHPFVEGGIDNVPPVKFEQ